MNWQIEEVAGEADAQPAPGQRLLFSNAAAAFIVLILIFAIIVFVIVPYFIRPDSGQISAIPTDIPTPTESPTVAATETASPTPGATPVPTSTEEVQTALCSSVLPARLSVGDQASVAASLVNVRLRPGSTNPIVDILAQGQLMNITGEPQCIDGQMWYEIRSRPFASSAGQRIAIGWIAEASDGDYLLQPSTGETTSSEPAASPRPAAAPLPSITPAATTETGETETVQTEFCPGTLPPRLSIGDRARVIDFQIDVRSGPGHDNSQSYTLGQGRLMDITGEPQCIDGQVWYEIRGLPFTSSSGQTIEAVGWVVEASGGNYLLEPQN